MTDNSPIEISIPRGRFSWPQLLLWLPASALLGCLAAWVAMEAQRLFAPLLLFPILVGVGLGALLVGLMRVAQVGHRRSILCGTVLAGVTAILLQHYISFCKVRSALRDRVMEGARAANSGLPPSTELADKVAGGFLDYMQEQAARGRPISPHYSARGWLAWLSWGLDGLLTLAAAIAMVLPAARLPYCDQCRTWYRTIRGGRVAAVTAQRLLDASRLAAGPIKSARYRFSNCHGGCGRTRFQLSWEEAGGANHSALLWLDTQQRNQLMTLLDSEEV
ncbi:MAG: hypothetical protein ABSG68_17900 [Thermoguttaceae bacterium]|jgi:hypothetical protein